MLNKMLITFFSFFSILLVVNFIPETASAERTTTIDVCRRRVTVIGSGVMSTGKRYVSIEYGVAGNDNARRFQDFDGVKAEPGWQVDTAAANCKQNGTTEFFWQDNNSVNYNNSSYRSLFTGFEPNFTSIANVYWGEPNGASVNPVDGFCSNPGVGSQDTGNLRPVYGIDKCASDPFASINDAGLVQINGQTIWCLGMGYTGDGNCRGMDAATVYFGGGDFAGFLNASNSNALNNVNGGWRNFVRNKTPFISGPGTGSFSLRLLAQNTRDGVAPFLNTTVCKDNKPGEGSCPGTDPVVNQKTSIIITYELNATVPTPPDLCQNMPGNQSTVPSDRTRIGNNCVFPPTCSASVSNAITIRDARFNSSVTINNPNNVRIELTSIQLNGPPAFVVGDVPNVNGNFVARPPNNDRTYTAADNYFNASATQGVKTLTWTVRSPAGNTTCSTTIQVRNPIIQTCSVSSVTSFVRESDIVRITVRNNDSFNLTGIDVSYTIEDSTGTRVRGPAGASTDDGNDQISANSSEVYQALVSPPLPSGQYIVKWTVDSDFGECPPNTNNITNGPFTKTLNPYVRFYGNDVIAGGGIGTSCPASGSSVTGFGRYVSPSTKNHSTYVGSASELAVFAGGLIEGVLPGSQIITRTAIAELAFANNDSTRIDTNAYRYGGGFNSFNCLNDFPADNSTAIPSDLSAITDKQFYTSPGNTTISTTSLNNGAKITINVNGNLTITGNITTANTSWVTVEEIPLIIFNVTGNIYIDNDVTELYGIYNSRNNIHTCTNVSTPYDSSNLNNIISECGNKLTVFGALNADKIYFLRTNGHVIPDPSVSPARTFPEDETSPEIAESIIFTPELYMAIKENFSENNGGKFDHIISLPPAY